MITDERRNELDCAWNECDLWSDEAYHEWWESLTDEEQALIDRWDNQYRKGLTGLIADILSMEEQEKFHQHTTDHNAASKINRPVPARNPLSFEERMASGGKKAAAVNQRRTAAKELTAAKSEINRRSERG